MFKKFALLVFLLSAIFVASSTEVYGQTRIRFAKGRYSATVSGRLPYTYFRDYVVNAREGQFLMVAVKSGTGLVVVANNYQTLYSREIYESGDYSFQILNTGPTTWFRVTVTIVRMPR
jgi:hypothetical protein